MDDKFIELIKNPNLIDGEHRELIEILWENNIEAIIVDNRIVLNNLSDDNKKVFLDLQSENDSFVKDSEEYSIVISNIDHLKEYFCK